MVARPGMTNEDYNQMLKDQKAAKRRGRKVRLKGDHVSWASVAQEIYGDQRWAEELARMNPDIERFHSSLTIKLPNKYKNPYISKSFLEGRSPYSLPGSDRQPLTYAEGTAIPASQQQAQGGPQPGFAQQRPPTGQYLDQPQRGATGTLFGMERLPLMQDDVYAVLYRDMLPGTVDRTAQAGFNRTRLENLGREPQVSTPTFQTPGMERAQAARQSASMVQGRAPSRLPGDVLPQEARVTGEAQAWTEENRMSNRANINRGRFMRTIYDPSTGNFFGTGRQTYRTQTAEERAANVARPASAEFQAPAYQNSEEIVVQFMREHPEIAQGDFSNVDIDQLAVLMNYGFVDLYDGTSAADATGTVPTGGGQAGYYGGGRGGGGGGGYSYPRYSSRYGSGGSDYGRTNYIGLVKWRI